MMAKSGLYLTAFALLSLCALKPALAAEEPTLIGTYGVWKAYSHKDGGNPLCFMSATPQKAEGKYSKRGKIYAMIAHRPNEKSRDVFSYIAGYTYKDSADVTVTIGKDKFILFGQGESAWTPSEDQDKRLASAIQKGSTMVVEGMSARGTKTKDTFSLKGSGDAYAAISKACGP
ncbi:MAG TPA: invasion associated locus B family protein [Alphaproteobacteria bacterium]|nr:invasion associated locus B family protein [Alphaproteobacteria bacterium]HNS43663.1 invasion associated locus B family protein [Alphaproteobacteria bacterium]